ncbi:hypothetical protein Trco_002142 [Trichoderma cornu-damae]|uniref:Peroxin 20 n=1 Tax=Trichoderma cornu-damae TaxID=654480 RepID=A0A9P8TUR7_9HYPO|nr:hypothetical protein Trco_002142 [Trichoderma cornu-damae]
MEDASCSASTPFKRLVDHQSRDLSHHQDRHVSRGAFGQNGQQDRFGAFMDGAFMDGAFMDGASALPGFESDATARMTPSLPFARAAPAQAAAHPGFSSPVQMGAPAPSGSSWAADFQRFSAQQQLPPASSSSLAPSRQVNHSSAPATYQPAFAQPSFASAFGSTNFNPPKRAPEEQDFRRELSHWMSAHRGGNMKEVDAAMEQMARELEESEAIAAAVAASRLTDLETPEIGNLSLESRQLEPRIAPAIEQELELEPELDPELELELEPEPELELEPEQELEEERANIHIPKSAVAEAAEKLLDCVKHESGEKWQNSIFLSLMRDFRDGRKDIVGDEIRSTGETAPAAQSVAT